MQKIFVYTQYEKWAIHNNEELVTKQKFYREMEKKYNRNGSIICVNRIGATSGFYNMELI